MITLYAFLQSRRRMLGLVFVSLLCCFALATLMLDRSSAHSWVERRIPFFWSGFALLASFGLIAFSRWLGRAGLAASPDAYRFWLFTKREDK